MELTTTAWVTFLIGSNLIGLIGNLLIILIFLFGTYHIRSPKIYPVVVMLTVIDTLQCAIVMPLSIASEIDADHFGSATQWLRFVHSTSVQCLALLSANLYFYLATPFAYNRLMHQKRALFISVVVLIASISIAFATVSINIDYNQRNQSISINKSSSSKNIPDEYSILKQYRQEFVWTCALPILVFLIPLAFCCVFGLLVLIIMIKIHKKLLHQVVSIGDRRLSVEQRRQFRRQLCHAVLFVLVKTALNVGFLCPYWLMWTSSGCTNQHSSYSNLLLMMHQLLNVNACIDPAITLLTQRNYRLSFKQLLDSTTPSFCHKVKFKTVSAVVRKYTLDQFTVPSAGDLANNNGSDEMDSDEFNVALHELRVLRLAVLAACIAPIAVAKFDSSQMNEPGRSAKHSMVMDHNTMNLSVSQNMGMQSSVKSNFSGQGNRLGVHGPVDESQNVSKSQTVSSQMTTVV